MKNAFDIALIGAGIAGLATAAFLARDGHRVTLFERFTEAEPVGAGLMIQPTGQAVLSCLGKREALVAAGAKVTKLDARTVAGRQVLTLDYADYAQDWFGLGTHRHTLFSLLREAAEEAGARFAGGVSAVRLTGLETRQPGFLDETGKAYGPFDLVADASGMFSQLRLEHCGEQPINAFDYEALWATVPFQKLQADTLHQRVRGTNIMLGILPIGRGRDAQGVERAAFYWSLPSRQETPSADWLVGQVANLWPDILPMIETLNAGQIVRARYGDINVAPRLGAHVLLLGDSAHGTSPQLGNGANLALLDALSLTMALREAGSVEEALTAHLKSRANHVWMYQYMSAMLTPFFQSDHAVLAWPRDLLFGPLCKAPFMRTEVVRIMSGIKSGFFSTLPLSRMVAAYEAGP